MTDDDYQFRYACWRFMVWQDGIPGLETYREIDDAVARGKLRPGERPTADEWKNWQAPWFEGGVT